MLKVAKLPAQEVASVQLTPELNAIPGTLRLLPATDAHVSALQLDYERMQVMLFGDRPDFDSILKVLGELEAEVNSLASKLPHQAT